MTSDIVPPSPETSPEKRDDALYTSAADDYGVVLPPVALADDDEDEDGDDDSGTGEGGSKGAKSKKDKKYEVILDPLLQFEEDAALSDDDNARRKLDALAISPMSLMVVGGTAFASENELSRKVFMANVGLVNLEIKPRDIADPDLVKKLDEKQAGRREFFGIKTLDDLVEGAIGTAAMIAGIAVASLADYVKTKKEEKALEKKARSYEKSKNKDEDIYIPVDDADDPEAMMSLEVADFPVQDNQFSDWEEQNRRRREVSDLTAAQPIEGDSPAVAEDDGGLIRYADVAATEELLRRTSLISLTDNAGNPDLSNFFNAVMDLQVQAFEAGQNNPSAQHVAATVTTEQQRPVLPRDNPMMR